MFRTKKSNSWFDKDYDIPDIEDIAGSLEATASLALTICCNFFTPNESLICSSSILDILARDDYNGHTTGVAHEYLSCYSILSDLIDMVYRRVKDAAEALQTRECRSLGYMNTSAPHTGDRYKIRQLIRLAEYVTLPEEYDRIGYDVIESVKENTANQNDVPLIAARFLMRIAYLLYSERICEATPDKTSPNETSSNADVESEDESQEDVTVDPEECEE